MREIKSEIEIFSKDENVWRILTDFNKYHQWNPFIDQIIGEPKEGSKLKVHIKPKGSRGTTFKPIITKIDPNKELRWMGHFGIAGFFDGEHIFTIDSIGNSKVKFTQREIFTGLLAPIISIRLNNAISSFEAMNQSLKAQAEKEI